MNWRIVLTLCMLFPLAGGLHAQPGPAVPGSGPAGAGLDQADPETDPEQQYELAKNAFYYQDYDRTISLLEPLLTPRVRLTFKEQLLHTREMLGASYWWRKDAARFREQFTRLLQDNPRFVLDAFYYPPEMVRDFSDLKQQLVEAGLIQVPPDEVPKPKVETQTYVMTPLALALVPFGVGQFANADTSGGILFLSLESGLLAANIGSWLWMYSANPHGTDRTVGLWCLYGSLGLLTGTAIWGIIDAVLNYEAKRLIEPPSSPGPDAAMPEGPWLAPSGFSLGWGGVGWQLFF